MRQFHAQPSNCCSTNCGSWVRSCFAGQSDDLFVYLGGLNGVAGSTDFASADRDHLTHSLIPVLFGTDYRPSILPERFRGYSGTTALWL